MTERGKFQQDGDTFTWAVSGGVVTVRSSLQTGMKANSTHVGESDPETLARIMARGLTSKKPDDE